MRISKWGNSLAVRLPKRLIDDLALKAGDEVAIVDATRERIALVKAERRDRALERMKARSWSLPPGYTFNRDEANER